MIYRITGWSICLMMVFMACGNERNDSVAELNVPVSVERVTFDNIEAYIPATGTIQARYEEKVVTEVEGIMRLTRSIKVGDLVAAGQLLAEIENPEYLLNVRVESEKMAMDNAQRELEKQEALFNEGGVTEKELEVSRRSALDAKLNYETALLKAEKISIRSPISGYITGLQTGANGTRVQTRFQICTIMDYTTVLVDIKLPNTDLSRVQQGQEVLVSNYALPDMEFKGRVDTIDPTIDPQTRTFTTTILVPNPNRTLRPGMFVKVNIIRESHENAVVIPKAALQVRDNRPVVFVVEGAIAEMREITTGIETRETIEIVSGLGESERLVVKGHETLRDKSKVRVLE